MHIRVLWRQAVDATVLSALQNRDNFIPFRLAYLTDSLVADFPEASVILV
jgi:hypothetical protein